MIRKEAVIAVLGSPVAYYAVFAKALGNVDAGVFASQFFYWHGKGRDPDGWVYKTQAEIEDETGLTRRNQETARRKLRALGVLEEKCTGLPAKLYYRMNIDVLFEVVTEWQAAQAALEAPDEPEPPASGTHNRPVAAGHRGLDGDQGNGLDEASPHEASRGEVARGEGARGAVEQQARMALSAIQDGGKRHPEKALSANSGSTNDPCSDGGKRHTNTKTTTQITTKTTTETTTATTTDPLAATAVDVAVDVAVLDLPEAPAVLEVPKLPEGQEAPEVPEVPDWVLEEFEFLLGKGRTVNATDRKSLAELAELPEHVVLQALDAAQAWLNDERKGPIFSLARWLLGTAKRKLEAEHTRGNSAISLPPEASPYRVEGYTPPSILRREEEEEAQEEEDEDAVFWKSVLRDLEMMVPIDLFDQWIRPLRLLSRNDGRYVIELGNKWGKDWIETRFAFMLRRLLSSRVGYAVEVCFELPAPTGAG